jgi:uncharacterized protein
MAGLHTAVPDATSFALECRSCGACCVPEITAPFYVHVVPADARRLTLRWRERHLARESLLTKVDPVGRCVCVALRGTVGRRVSCTIYPRRPTACRRLRRGSAECHKARQQAELE